jgi:DNA-binding NtrC family response regulator
MQTILVIDDNEGVCKALEVLFSLHELRTLCAHSPGEGLALLESESVDLVVQDMNFTADTTSGEEGKALFREIRRRDADLPVILFTAWTDLESAVALVKAGASDYVAKPWDDEKLLATVENLLELREATSERRRLDADRRAARRRLAERYELCGIVYESELMHELLVTATRVAPSGAPVLITGPNGAGKELVANIVQANSRVKDGPFVKVNMGALPADLVEAELFGAEAGAYTGAVRAREGRFEAADGGTIFLDEIGNLPLASQAKLLRVLQTGEFERLGSTKTRRVDVRVISATNADLDMEVAEGRFREDLYYRLNVIELPVPPLAERPDDILPLARHFLADGRELSGEAARALRDHAWPGNVRQLANVIERACLLADGEVLTTELLGLEKSPRRRAPEAGDEPDAAAIDAALGRHGGVVARAARELGMSRQALYRRMDKFGIGKD